MESQHWFARTIHMRTIAVLAFGIAACANPGAAPVLANTSRGPSEPPAEPANCSVVASDSLRVAGELARAEVIACDLGDKPADEQDPDGLKIRSWEGFVKLTRANGQTLRAQFADWTDGWEWGGGVGMEGPLVATNAKNDAVLVVHYQSSIDVLSQATTAFAVLDGKLVRVGTWTHELRTVRFSKARDVARVESCVTGDPTVKHAGCGDRGDADPGPTLQLRWTGTKIDETVLSGP